MKLSHILYKVNNLDQAVENFRSRGFAVEYGSKHKPHNALIYFSEGPYIELLEEAPLPFYFKVLLQLMGQGKVVERLASWKQQNEGYFEICLENYTTDFQNEERILKSHNQGFFKTKSKRNDPHDRLLKWNMLFPHDLRLPFMMTYFSIDPKPKNFAHPNGMRKITHVVYGIEEELISIVRELCDDESLELAVGDGVLEVSME